MMRRTYSFKLYTSKKQKRLQRQLWIASQVYNHCIALHKRYYRRYKKHINVFRLLKHVTRVKQWRRFSHWQELGSQAIQDVVQRIERGYQLFFDSIKQKSKRKVRPPSFKGYRKYRSITLKQAGYKLLEGNRIKVGKTIYKYHKSREIEGRIKTVTIKRDALGDFYIYLSCEDVKQSELPLAGQSAGFDFGLKTFLTTNDGQKIESPLFFKLSRSNIRKASKSLSSKIKGSNHRRKARLHLARVHKKVGNRRHDFHVKLAQELVYNYDILYFEDLNVSGMKRLYGRKVSDLGFADFLRTLKSFAESRGKTVVQVGRFEPTSKVCSDCLYRLDTLPLKIREWDCPNCDSHHDRDINAARNIYRVGTSTLRLDGVRPPAKEATVV